MSMTNDAFEIGTPANFIGGDHGESGTLRVVDYAGQPVKSSQMSKNRSVGRALISPRSQFQRAWYREEPHLHPE